MMRRAGARMGAVAGMNQIQIEWYPSLKAFFRGIEKNAFAFSQYSLAVLLAFTLATVAVFCGFAVAPFLTGSPWYGAFTGVALLIYLFSIRTQLGHIIKMRTWMVLTFPVAFVVLPLLFLRASLLTIRRGGINWRGTFYKLEELKTNQRMKLANLVFSSAPETAAASTPVEAAVEIDVESAG
jgi:hypothetical protein